MAAELRVLFFFLSHGFGNTGGDAGNASDVEQRQSTSQRQNQANAVERYVRHSSQVEEVRTSEDLSKMPKMLPK